MKFDIEVPKGRSLIRLPLNVVSSDESIFKYWLKISLLKKPYRVSLSRRGKTVKSEQRLALEKSGDIPKEKMKASDEKVVDYSKVDHRFSTWVGFGMNFVEYIQKNSNPTANSSFRSFLFGSLFLDFQYNFSQEWAARFEYKQSPGKVIASENDLRTSGDYTWTTITPEAVYVNRDGSFSLLGKKFTPMFRVGVQSHSVPFLLSKDSGGTVFVEKINSISLTNLSLGAGFVWSGLWRPVYELFMRYQHTLSSDSNYEISPGFSFDGSIGMVIPFKSGLKVGLYWYGQSHSFKYVFNNGEALKPTGEEQLFYSNIDVRVGYEF